MQQTQEIDFMSACQRTRRSPWRMKDAIARGLVGARKDDQGRWRINARDVEQLAAEKDSKLYR